MDSKNALMFIYDLACRATLVAKDNGRESGLTAGDHAQLRQAVELVAQTLDAGAALQKEVPEVKDELARLRAEVDQLKAANLEAQEAQNATK